jgi:Cu-Zn family superoxide dismutase
MLTKSILLSASFALIYRRTASSHSDTTPLSRSAICILYPTSTYSSFKGLVSFHQETPTSATQIVVSANGLKPNSLHGFHIHEFGDLTDGCATAGAHYNPKNKTHGGPLDEERHVGDLGNLKTDERGNTYLAMNDKMIKLFGDESVVGRSCVIHEENDDLGRGGFTDSKTTGHSGARIACGIIGLSNGFKNMKMG